MAGGHDPGSFLEVEQRSCRHTEWCLSTIRRFLWRQPAQIITKYRISRKLGLSDYGLFHREESEASRLLGFCKHTRSISLTSFVPLDRMGIPISPRLERLNDRLQRLSQIGQGVFHMWGHLGEDGA